MQYQDNALYASKGTIKQYSTYDAKTTSITEYYLACCRKTKSEILQASQFPIG